ncbi:Multicopper oxidase/laccase [Mycena indigotica]|uniref:Multicopper oxidase/laccase n=1 Tax=Mycena indigotica TaxID=2126181 RepID=A0A8H6W1N3_9AGAR|nr:Multicopper oxidase/laccase [Mycena indigotica]KAF7302234.1 Multicopper oxidase/laccase [Mycena indigotica]
MGYYHALFFFLSLLSGGLAIGPGSVTNLKIVNQNVSLDGFSRSAVLAGGTFPGTPILANKGDRFLINVVDQLTDPSMLRSTSVHWHGIFMKDSAWADGTSFVTQCPIAANNSFLYDFTPSGQVSPNNSCVHANDVISSGRHFLVSLPFVFVLFDSVYITVEVDPAMQYCDGLRGPLIIYDPNDPHKHLYDVDDATTIISLADWFHESSRTAPFPLFYTTNTINGKGRFTGGPAADLAVISVKRGSRYRFRLISMSCEPNFIFSIDKHSMTVIEADGVSTQPLVVDSIQIFTGQRYSFVLNANQRVSNYWVRSLPNLGDTTFANGVNSAILRYAGAEKCDPKTNQTASTRPLVESNLHPLVPTVVPGLPFVGGADVNINLNIGLDFTTFRFNLNGVSFSPPTAPALLQILSGAQLASDLLPSGSYFALPPNKVIEVTIPGGADPAGPHPFHLHGHNFFVLRSTNTSEYNFVDPVIRDVVNTGFPGDNVTFRFVTDNAGPWFLHCHIDLHLDIGLAVVFAEDTGSVSKEVIPSAWNNLCPIYDALDPSQL